MSKYENINIQNKELNINDVLVEGEEIIWEGKPKKNVYIFNQIATMLPFALIWLLFDSVFIIAMFTTDMPKEVLWFVIPFFAIHLMPVWVWLSNALTANKKWKNTIYALTNKRIIISSGFIGVDYQTIFYKDIKNVNLNVGVIDKFFKVGDLHFNTGKGRAAFLDIADCYELYPKIQKVVLDIQTDIEYPNNLRPNENDGYNTKYTRKF